MLKRLMRQAIDLAGLNFVTQSKNAAGAIPGKGGYSFISLNNAVTALAMTLTAPHPGTFLVITQADAGTAGHTVTLAAGTFDGSSTVATFNAQSETLVLFGISTTRFAIIENIGSVGLA